MFDRAREHITLFLVGLTIVAPKKLNRLVQELIVEPLFC